MCAICTRTCHDEVSKIVRTNRHVGPQAPHLPHLGKGEDQVNLIHAARGAAIPVQTQERTGLIGEDGYKMSDRLSKTRVTRMMGMGTSNAAGYAPRSAWALQQIFRTLSK